MAAPQETDNKQQSNQQKVGDAQRHVTVLDQQEGQCRRDCRREHEE
jgi:hypothetical protein